MGRRRVLLRSSAQESVIFQIRNPEFGMRNYGVASRRILIRLLYAGAWIPFRVFGFRIVFKEDKWIR